MITRLHSRDMAELERPLTTLRLLAERATQNVRRLRIRADNG